ncbi:gamma-glutamyltransferase [Solemya velum gill symbiont]|nr:gamma-glutamyltransferase [Solemya velum gill symbiont]OOY50336.1 gamma-glutamyltransferase [Solemya velum gill symbiont]OOY54498.1 gamma-glutamyltransferase [Solemya velum gill symbiont]OOY54976.1 gamma-glutamyltransferase [Solemya velum gill symbiont]OOY59179.1 gamma-glutamyltransferase [Solemya velum gill symbiont]OOY60543.1 gamma-glutamyltransferase [Solemya velum gill symbiont]
MRLLVSLCVLLVSSGISAKEPVAPPVIVNSVAVASAHPYATATGLQILRDGGNAFDAAVAVTAVLAVVEPYSSGLGGGGFYLLHRASDDRQVMLDARETAPLEATRDMYLGEDGKPTSDSLEGPLSAGIPGIPAALAKLAQEYGKLPLKQTLAPAIAFAKAGFEVDAHYQRMASMRLKLLTRDSESARIFLHNKEVPPLGHLVIQRDLAQTLGALAEQGRAGFYGGRIATALVREVRRNGGIWRLQDLSNYRVIEREPISFDYRGWKVTTVAPPSSGGVALATMFNILEPYDLDSLDEVMRTHLIVEAMRLAYRDRAEYLGDSDFVDVPVSKLINKSHAASLRKEWIKEEIATPSDFLPVATAESAKGRDTTHFSILDKEGNRVAATLSINYPFGSGYVAAGTGVLLNDEMDDFSALPGSPNVYGLIGAEANSIAPGKRPLSSMSPAFVENDQRLAILGTPGGSRIITMVLLGALEFMKGGDAHAIVSKPRFHHQYLPDSITYEEDAISEDAHWELGIMGHQFSERMGSYGEENPVYGNMQAVTLDKLTGEVSAASDPRVSGIAGVR